MSKTDKYIEIIDKLIDLTNDDKIKWKLSKQTYRDKEDLWDPDYNVEVKINEFKCLLSVLYGKYENKFHILFYEKEENKFNIIENITNNSYDVSAIYENNNELEYKIFQLFDTIKNKITIDVNEKEENLNHILNTLKKY